MILAVTPCRGGSKGLPKKNIRPIAGKPLVCWTIDAAKKSKLIDKYIVSTDSEEIAKVCSDYGTEVMMRPPELATDNSPIIDTLQYILKQHKRASILVLLQAPCPIRNEGRIDECIKLFLQNHVDSVVTGYQNYCIEYGTDEGRSTNRQDRKGFFWDDGNVYVFSAESIRQGKLKTKNYVPVYVTPEESLDIDDELTFWLCEQVLLKRINEIQNVEALLKRKDEIENQIKRIVWNTYETDEWKKVLREKVGLVV